MRGGGGREASQRVLGHHRVRVLTPARDHRLPPLGGGRVGEGRLGGGARTEVGGG